MNPSPNGRLRRALAAVAVATPAKKKGKRNSRTPSPRFRSLRSEIDFAISEAQRAEYLSLNDNTLNCMVGLAYEASVQAWGASAGDSKAIWTAMTCSAAAQFPCISAHGMLEIVSYLYFVHVWCHAFFHKYFSPK